MFDRQKAREIWDMSEPGLFLGFDDLFPEEDGEITVTMTEDGDPALVQDGCMIIVSNDFVRRMIDPAD
jgi:hypothetical protein